MNIFDNKVEVDKPQGVSTQSLMLYVPKVTTRNAGIATYDNEDFIISKGNVSLYKLYNIAEITYDDTHLARSGAVKQYIDLIKVDLDDVKKELAEKASILYVDTRDDIIKQSITSLDIRLTDEINTKADTTYVDDKLDTKADITYVDDKLDTKADITYVDDKFNNMKSYVDGNVITINTNIDNINDKINAIVGIGGYLTAHDFGTATPTQQELTDYALSQISSISSADEIWNGTKITNLYDNHTWVLTNTPNTVPAIFEWSDIGFEFISVATNERLGVVKGSTDDYKVSVANDGTMSINNLVSKLEMIDSDFRDIDAKFLVVNGTISTLESEIENNIGLIDKVAFVGILEDNRLKFYLDESQKDFEFRSNREYNLLLHLPLTTLTGDLDNNLPIDLYNKPVSQKNDATQIARMILNSILSNDPTNTTTVGKLCQLQNYSPTNGYTWNFNADYIQYEENGITYRVMYTTDVTRESNPSMTGADLAMAISDATLKSGTTVIVTSDYTDNGYNYLAGHTYLIKGEWIDNELVLSTLELQTGGGSTYTAGNNISIENNVIDTKNVLRLDTEELQTMNGSVNLGYSPHNTAQFLGISLFYNKNDNYAAFKIGKNGGKANLENDKYLQMRFGDRYNDISLNDRVYIEFDNSYGRFRLPRKDTLKPYILAITDDVPKYSGLVLNQMSGNVNGDTVNLTFDKVNLSTGESGTADTYQFGPASETTPGLMTSADVKALSDLQQRVGNLETKTTRLIYMAKTDPTAEEINTFVTGLGYTTPFSGIAVVVDKTYHIWHYYENDGWKDDGIDTVNIFTNEIAGAIKGAGEIAGKIYAENDGTGSVYGWDDLNTKVNEKQDKLTAGNNISITNDIIDTKNVLRLDNTEPTAQDYSLINLGQNLTATDRFLGLTAYKYYKDDKNYQVKYQFGNYNPNGRTQSTDDNGLSIIISNSNNVKDVFLMKSQSGQFRFPDKSGTFALTSDIPDVSEPQYIEIDVTNSTTGTLTTEQLNILKASNQNYIKGKISRDVPEMGYSIKSTFEMRLMHTRTRTRNGVTTNDKVYCDTNYEDGSLIVLDTDSGTYNYSSRTIQPSIDYYTTLRINNSDNNGSTTTSGTLSDDDINIILNYKRSVQLEFSDSVYATLRYTISIENSLLYTGIGADGLFYYAAIDTSNKTWTLNSTTTVSALLDSQFKLYNNQWEAVESSYGSFKQRLAYEHSTRSEYQYTMQPLPTSLREWANCGVGAFEETENDITFYAETKPTNDLSFNIKWEIVYRNRDSEV